ncbi:hypothetical protein Micbo1qcDRAFT_172947 [Microdochium bolleyi]|uniref:Uncharacterized protein n=1 Tax=Microdochium bolleyi TaxID=196109 RepID=A0A136JAA5_9PEZI|nr:hypothetical protein Micbo1qcDRAFT_172947 [Microdochium bolleyi]
MARDLEQSMATTSSSPPSQMTRTSTRSLESSAAVCMAVRHSTCPSERAHSSVTRAACGRLNYGMANGGAWSPNANGVRFIELTVTSTKAFAFTVGFIHGQVTTPIHISDLPIAMEHKNHPILAHLDRLPAEIRLQIWRGFATHRFKVDFPWDQSGFDVVHEEASFDPIKDSRHRVSAGQLLLVLGDIGNKNFAEFCLKSPSRNVMRARCESRSGRSSSWPFQHAFVFRGGGGSSILSCSMRRQGRHVRLYLGPEMSINLHGDWQEAVAAHFMGADENDSRRHKSGILPCSMRVQGRHVRLYLGREVSINLREDWHVSPHTSKDVAAVASLRWDRLSPVRLIPNFRGGSLLPKWPLADSTTLVNTQWTFQSTILCITGNPAISAYTVYYLDDEDIKTLKKPANREMHAW